MILAPNLQSAMDQAVCEASATGRRQRVSFRPILFGGYPWFVIEPAAPPRRRDALNNLPPELLDPIGMTPARPAGERIPLGDIDFGRHSRV